MGQRIDMAGLVAGAYSQTQGNNQINIKPEAQEEQYRVQGNAYPGVSVQKGENKKYEGTYNIQEQMDEYLQKQQANTASEEDVVTGEEEDKEAAKEIRENLTHEELEYLRMLGIDIENAKLSELMGMVNTLRANAHREEKVAMFAEIKARNAEPENIQLAGSKLKVEGVTLDANDLAYIIDNELPLTKEDLYKAHYSGVKPVEKEISQADFEKMLPQIEKIVEQAGYAGNEKAISGAKYLIGNELPVTTDSIRTYMEYSEYVGKDIAELDIPETKNELENELAQKLYDETASIDPDKVEQMAREGRELTLASIKEYRHEAGKNDNEDADYRAVVARRQVEEIRLSMTYQASARLVKLDVNIDTRELSQVVDSLRQIETELAKRQLKNAGVEPSTENARLLTDITDSVRSLAGKDAGVLAVAFSSQVMTVEGLTEASGYERTFETVRRSYEAVGTAPRADMGDSITKAFANIDEILGSLDMEASYENQRAVKILGYNRIELTAENITRMVDMDRQVNELMDTFYPEAVLGMIKDGINPMEVPIDELVKTIRDKNYNAGVTEAKNFATYLMDVERRGEITAEERESYIGIYRMMDKLAKSGDREAGWIFANNSRLTVKNLLAAMRSKKATGADITVDDDFGLLEEVSARGTAIDEQIEKAFRELPENVEEYIIEKQITYTMNNAEAVNTMINTPGGIYEAVSNILASMKFGTNEKEELVDEETENMSRSIQGEEISADPGMTMESILELLGDDDRLSLTYEDMRNQLTEMMYTATNLTALDISAIKTVNAGFNILSGMARRGSYQIPLDTEDGIRVVNLTVEKSATAHERLGKISISIKDTSIGNVMADIETGKNGEVTGSITSSTTDGNYAIAGVGEEITIALHNLGATSIKISCGGNVVTGEVNNMQETEATETPSLDATFLYKTSVTIIQTVSKIIS